MSIEETTVPGHVMPRPPIRETSWGERAVLVALQQIGRGEEGGNNRGPSIDEYARMKRVTINWCAAFVSWVLEEAFPPEDCKGLFRSLGARRLVANLLELQRAREVDLRGEKLQRGDVVLWSRGPAGSWFGHVGLVSSVHHPTFDCIEGNVGRFPARVQCLVHTVTEPKLIRAVRLPS